MAGDVFSAMAAMTIAAAGLGTVDANNGEPTRVGSPRPCGRVDQFAAPDAVKSRREGCRRRLLHLYLHQLVAHASVSSAPGRRNTGKGSS